MKSISKPVVKVAPRKKRLGWGSNYCDPDEYRDGVAGRGYGHGQTSGNADGTGLVTGMACGRGGLFAATGFGFVHEDTWLFSSFSIKGDDNLLGLFHAKASFLGEMPEKGEYLTLTNLAVLADRLRLAKELGLKAKAVIVSRYGKSLEELHSLYP